jgi:hypothetical protein
MKTKKNTLIWDEVSRYQIREALRNASNVLSVVKQLNLNGEALSDMKLLENTVSDLEVLNLKASKGE